MTSFETYMSQMSLIRPTTYTAIIEAAFQVLNDNPGAALSDIADRAGVGRATLHRHFSSRDDLVRALILIAIKEMDEAVATAVKDAQSYSDAFETMFSTLIPLGDRHGFLTREPMDDDPTIAAELKRLTQETHDIIEAVKREGLFETHIPTSWIEQAFNYLLYAAWDSIKNDQLTETQAIDLAWRTFTRGLGPNELGKVDQ